MVSILLRNRRRAGRTALGATASPAPADKTRRTDRGSNRAVSQTTGRSIRFGGVTPRFQPEEDF